MKKINMRKNRLINKNNRRYKRSSLYLMNEKYVEMLLSKHMSTKNSKNRKTMALEENEKMNKYVIHLRELYKQFKFEECLNYGLENIEKLKKKDYVGKIEILKIIGNVYFYLENYKYGSLTYILLSKYLNKVSDKYKIEICYNAGVIFIKYFLESNNISYYLNAKNSFHCSLLYNEKGSKHFNQTIYENTIRILRQNFSIDGKEQAKIIDDQNDFFENSSYENFFLDNNKYIARSSNEENETKEFSSSEDSKSCTLKSSICKIDEVIKGNKNKNYTNEGEDVYFASNNKEKKFTLYNDHFSIKDATVKKDKFSTNLEKKKSLLIMDNDKQSCISNDFLPWSNSLNIQIKENKYNNNNKVSPENSFVSLSKEECNIPNNFCNNVNNILFRDPMSKILKNTHSPFMKSKSISFINNSPRSILKSESYNILNKSPDRIINNSSVNFVRQPTGNILRSFSNNFFNNSLGSGFANTSTNMMNQTPVNIMNNGEANFVQTNQINFTNNSNTQFLSKTSPCIFPINTTPCVLSNHYPRNFSCNAIHTIVRSSSMNFVNREHNLSLNNTSPISDKNNSHKRMSQQKSIIKYTRGKTNEKANEEEVYKNNSNLNGCRAFDSVLSIEHDLLEHKRRKTNNESSHFVPCENSVQISNNFLALEKEKACSFDYCNIEEKVETSEYIENSKRDNNFFSLEKSNNIKEEKQVIKPQRGRPRKYKVEKGMISEGKEGKDQSRKEKNKRERIKKEKMKKMKRKKSKSKRSNNVFDELFSVESKSASIRSVIKNACKEYESRLVSEYYHIYYLKNKKKKAKQIVKRKRISDFFHDLYEICKKNKYDFLVKFVDQVVRYKSASCENATPSKGFRKRSNMNNTGTLIRVEKDQDIGKIDLHESNSDLEKLGKNNMTEKYARKSSQEISAGISVDRSVKQEEEKRDDQRSGTVKILEMSCEGEQKKEGEKAGEMEGGKESEEENKKGKKEDQKEGHKLEPTNEQKNESRGEGANFDTSEFINLYNELRKRFKHRSFNDHAYNEKYKKEKEEIEEVIILSINKINKKRIRDKLKKISSYNNSILSNIGDKFIDDIDELFLIKNYSKILKSIKKNNNIKHIYYLYENMYAIDKVDHINSSNFFNISHFIIDILLLKEIKQKDYLKKKILKMKYSYFYYFANYDSTDSGALFKDIFRHILNDTTKDSPKKSLHHIMHEMNPHHCHNFNIFNLSRRSKTAELHEQNYPYTDIKLSSTTIVNNSDTNSYTNQKKEELIGERLDEFFSNEYQNSDKMNSEIKNSNLSLKNNENTIDRDPYCLLNSKDKEKDDEEMKQCDMKISTCDADGENDPSGVCDTNGTNYKNKIILQDWLSISSDTQLAELNLRDINSITHAPNCERENVYIEMSKEDKEILDIEQFYEYINISDAYNMDSRIKAEEIIMLLFYHYCWSCNDGNSSSSISMDGGDKRSDEYRIRNVLFKIFFFFTTNNIINKTNIHEYVTFLRLYHFYLTNINCYTLTYFYHNIEKDGDKVINNVERKKTTHHDFISCIMFDNCLNVIHCHLYILKLLYKCYMNRLKRKYTYDNVNLEILINYTFSILNCLLIKFSYNEEDGTVERRVLFLFLQFLYLNSKYYFKNVTFFLDKYDINYLVKSETGNFCKVNADRGRGFGLYKNNRKRGPNPKNQTKGNHSEFHKGMFEGNNIMESLMRKRSFDHEEHTMLKSGYENARQAQMKEEEEKSRSEQEDYQLDIQEGVMEEEQCYDGERAGAKEEEPYEEGTTHMEESYDKLKKYKEMEKECRYMKGIQNEQHIDKEEWHMMSLTKKGQLRKKKSTTQNSYISNMEKFKKVFTKLDENVNITFSSFLKCYNKCFFLLNLKLYENDMFRKIIWKKIDKIVNYCNTLYTTLKIKKIPINKNYNYVFDEINYTLYNKNIFLKPSFFKVLREDNYVNRMYNMHRNYIAKMSDNSLSQGNKATENGREKRGEKGGENWSGRKCEILKILISFEKLNKGTYKRVRVNKKKKRFLLLAYSYKYIKKCICKELKENSILSLYKRAKEVDENFSQSIDYLHSLFDTRLCMLSLDFEIQNIIIEFVNDCVNFIMEYQMDQHICFSVIKKLMNIYSFVFSIFYLRLNSFSEIHTNKLYKILGIEKDIFSYDDKATWNMLNIFNFVNFRYGCSYNFLNNIFTSFHVLINTLVKIDIHIEVDKKYMGKQKVKRHRNVNTKVNGSVTNLFNYDSVQKHIEREKRKKKQKNMLGKQVSQSIGQVHFGRRIMYKIVNEVRKKVSINGKLKIKNSILDKKIGKKMNKYFVNPMGDKVSMKKLENHNRISKMCLYNNNMECVKVSYSEYPHMCNSSCSAKNYVKDKDGKQERNKFLVGKNHLNFSSTRDDINVINTSRCNPVLAIQDGIIKMEELERKSISEKFCTKRSRRQMWEKGEMPKKEQLKFSSRNERILQSYEKLKKSKKKLKKKINNAFYFKHISVTNKSQHKIYTTLSCNYAHILFILISILHIENYNILHLRKMQDFFMNNDIYNTYYIFLHISSSIILLLSSVLKTYLHFNPYVNLDNKKLDKKKISKMKSRIVMNSAIDYKNKLLHRKNEKNEDLEIGNKEGHDSRLQNLEHRKSISRIFEDLNIKNCKSDNNDVNRSTFYKDKGNSRSYEIYLETFLNYSSINVLLMSKKKHNKKNKMKKNKYIYIFCNLIENLLQNSVFYLDLFSNCKNRGDVLELNDVFSKLNKLCKENNIMNYFVQMKNELIYHTLFRYILQKEYVNYFNIEKCELYNINKCSINLFYFSLNILLTSFNTDISIHLERSLYNINYFHHDNLYYELILNNIKKTIRYIRGSTKSSFNCIFSCVLYYLARWKNGEGKILKGRNNEEKKNILRRSNSNQRFSSSCNIEGVKSSVFFNILEKEECLNNTMVRNSINKNTREKTDNKCFFTYPTEGTYSVFKNNEEAPLGCDKYNYFDIYKRNRRKIVSKIIYDMIIPYIDIKNIKVYNKIHRNNHTINSLINICFSFLFNNFLFLKLVYPFDIVSKDKIENELTGKRIKITNDTLDIFNMKMSEIKPVELFLSLYIHKYMQSICLDVKKLVDYNTYMNQFFWISSRRHLNFAPCRDYTYLNYSFNNVYYKFNDYNVLQFLINFKRSKSEGKVRFKE